MYLVDQAIVLQGKGSGGYVEPVKAGETVKIKMGEPMDATPPYDVDVDLDVDVDSQLLYEYDIKTPLYSPKIHLPPGQPVARLYK